MTSSELHEIVKDCPEAWPTDCHYYKGMFSNVSSSDWPDYSILDAHAVLMFIGSGTHWLIGEGYHKFEWDTGETDATPPTLTLYGITVDAPTPVAAIFAAIKAVKGQA